MLVVHTMRTCVRSLSTAYFLFTRYIPAMSGCDIVRHGACCVLTPGFQVLLVFPAS